MRSEGEEGKKAAKQEYERSKKEKKIIMYTIMQKVNEG